MDVAETDRWIAAAEAAVDAAGSVIRRYFRAGIAADVKADDSPVTRADREAEQAMRAVLNTRCPGTAVMGEEYGGRANDGLFWLLDPIDGTRAFITGRPLFTTLVALMDGPAPVIGVIDQPVTGERWVGAAGRATVFRGPFGGVAGTRRCGSLDRAELGCTAPEIFTAQSAPRWRRLADRVARVSWGGDAYAYGLLSLGQIDAIAEATLQPWDWAALVPVVTGAGGCVTDWAGAALRLDGPGEVLALGDPALLAATIAALAA